MKKKGIIAVCAILTILVVAVAFILTTGKGNVSNVNRIVGYSALYMTKILKTNLQTK